MEWFISDRQILIPPECDNRFNAEMLESLELNQVKAIAS